MGPHHDSAMVRLTKAQQKKYQPTLLRILRNLGVKLERMEEAVLLAQSDSGGDDGEDLGAEGYSRDFQLGLIENEDVILRSVRAALQRIELGTFGTCDDCEELIPPRRLEVVPYTRFCVECKQQAENAGD